MDDSLETVTTVRRGRPPKAPAPPKAPTVDIDALASTIEERLQQRFLKLESVTGEVRDSGQWYFLARGPKGRPSCEAIFPAGTKADKIYGSFYGWASDRGQRLGVPKKKREDMEDLY